MGLKKITTEEFISKFKLHFPQKKYNLSETKYIDANTTVTFKCIEHGEVKAMPYTFFKNVNLLPCKKCRKEQIKIRVTNIDTFITKANIIHNNVYDYSESIYLGNSSNITIKCLHHGYFTLVVDEHLSSQRSCPQCTKDKVKLKSEDILLRFKEIHKDKYSYAKNVEYNTTLGKIKILCPIHGEFEQKILIHLQGHGCSQCGKDNLRLTNEEFIIRAKSIHGNKYSYENTNYVNYVSRVIITCNNHGEFEQTPLDHLNGCGCQSCASEKSNYSSKYEKEILTFIKHNSESIIIKECFRKYWKEIDIYLPEYNLGIEFNGVYWHSDKFKDKSYHKDKSEMFRNNGINIFHIWEYDWVNPNKQSIIKSMILNKLKLNKVKIYARKCEIKEIGSKEYRQFCDQNHIQGYCNAKIKLGLCYNSELVSVMSFGNLRINLGNKDKNINEWELVRFCNKLNTNNIGGASRLLKHFIKTYHPLKIISYANEDYSNGNLYTVLGFEDKGFTNISYSYYNPKTNSLKNRFNYRKSELVKMGYDKNLTEFQITDSMGLFRIYNSGTKKFEMKL